MKCISNISKSSASRNTSCDSARMILGSWRQKFVDEPELWIKTEDMVRDVLKNSGINYVEVPNEAAFYGPKIDVQVWSVIGREFTLATNQVDFAVPANLAWSIATATTPKRLRCASIARRWARTSGSLAF